MKEKVRQIIADHLCVDVEEIEDNVDLVDELGLDSLDLVEITYQIEDEFDIRVDDEVIESLRTVNDIVEYINEAM